MMMQTETDHATETEKLLRRGTVHFKSGDFRGAHRAWRRAAMLSPYNIDVWRNLQRVVSSDEDRRVCLQNILAIDPNDEEAAASLNVYFEDTAPVKTVSNTPPEPSPALVAAVKIVIWLIEAIIIAALVLAVVIFIAYI